MYFRKLRLIKEFANRYGRRAGNYNRYYIAAGIQLKQEFFMVPRTMRGYWDEQQTAIYPPCNCVSRWLKYKSIIKQ